MAFRKEALYYFFIDKIFAEHFPLRMDINNYNTKYKTSSDLIKEF